MEIQIYRLSTTGMWAICIRSQGKDWTALPAAQRPRGWDASESEVDIAPNLHILQNRNPLSSQYDNVLFVCLCMDTLLSLFGCFVRYILANWFLFILFVCLFVCLFALVVWCDNIIRTTILHKLDVAEAQKACHFRWGRFTWSGYGNDLVPRVNA